MFGRRLTNLMIVLAVLLATCLACGGDGGEGATATPTVPPAAAEPAPTTQPTGAAILALGKTTLAPNEEFQVRFTAAGSPGWASCSRYSASSPGCPLA
jgi:hypothetical protein